MEAFGCYWVCNGGTRNFFSIFVFFGVWLAKTPKKCKKFKKVSPPSPVADPVTPKCAPPPVACPVRHLTPIVLSCRARTVVELKRTIFSWGKIIGYNTIDGVSFGIQFLHSSYRASLSFFCPLFFVRNRATF